MGGGGRWLSRLEEDNWNSSQSDLSVVNVERSVTIASGEMYPERGMPQRERWTRSVADKSSLGKLGNGIRSNESDRRRGANPPRNKSGTTGSVISFDTRSRYASAGNGSCSTAKTFSISEL